jgi:hypothetical protein
MCACGRAKHVCSLVMEVGEHYLWDTLFAHHVEPPQLAQQRLTWGEREGQGTGGGAGSPSGRLACRSLRPGRAWRRRVRVGPAKKPKGEASAAWAAFEAPVATSPEF